MSYPIIDMTAKEAYTKTIKEVFTINEVEITLCDFGDVSLNLDKNIPYGLPEFTPGPVRKEVLTKYQISEDNYLKIAEALKEKVYWVMGIPHFCNC